MCYTVAMYNNAHKTYGPYTCKDGRKRICFVWKDGRKQTVSYPKYLMECHLGKFLEPGESVDHIDRDFTNDNLDNLRVVNHSKHASDDTRRLVPQTFTCGYCNKDFVLSGNKLSRAIDNRRKGKAGPFCNRSCAGKYGAAVQNGRIEKLKVNLIKQKYYHIDK